MINKSEEQTHINNPSSSTALNPSTDICLSFRSEESSSTNHKLSEKPSTKRMMLKTETSQREFPINFKSHRYPYCLVWTPFPFISSIFPLFGHVGIGNSKGIINDFSSSNYVTIDNMGFSWPYKYVRLNPSEEEKNEWDSAIGKANKLFTKKRFGIFDTNCHSYVCHILNSIRYKGRSDYSKCDIMMMMIRDGVYINKCSVVKVYIWPLLFMCIVAIIVSLVICL